MIRAMYTAITSLGLHQTFMDVTADNLANVNTPGYKGSKVLFQDLFSQLQSPGSAPQENVGGINPIQVGLGLRVGYISPHFTQGTLNSTGRTSDLAIQGDGFFIYETAEGEKVYSREGSLQIDSAGFLVNSSTGLRLQGWLADKTQDPDVDPNWPSVDLQVPLERSIAEATTEVSMAGNLKSLVEDPTNIPVAGTFDPTVNAVGADTDADGYNDTWTYPAAWNDPNSPNNDTYYDVTVGFYDSLGVEKTTRVRFTRQGMIDLDADGTDDVTPWTATIAPALATDDWWNHNIDKGGTAAVPALTPAVTAGNVNTIYFDLEGQVHSINGITAANIVDLTEVRTHLPVVTVPGEQGAEDTTFMLDIRNLSMLSQAFTVSMSQKNGIAPGSVTDIDVSADTGEIYILYSNGEREKLGQLAVAAFTNPTGLLRMGRSQFQEGINSGAPMVGAPMTGGRGSVSSGYLEGSNVDMGQEFTNMIMAQRGFQASTRTIRASDEMLLELVNLKR